MIVALFLGVVLATSLFGLAFAQGFGDSPFERDFGDIKFLDSYFGTFENQSEVSPGDKNVPFTIVLANVGTHDITGIRGELSLPYGFTPSDSIGYVAQSDSNTNSEAGEVFYLTFFLNLEPNISIQQYPGAAKVEYSRLRESGLRNAYFDFYFRVPGSSTLHVTAMDPFLVSLQANTATIQLVNNGTAPMSSVDVRTLGLDVRAMDNTQTSTSNVVIYESSWDLGNIEPHSVALLDVTIYIPETMRGDILRLPLEITHFDAHGNKVTQNKTVDFYVRGLVDAVIYGVETITISDNLMVIGEIINEGNEDARFGFVSLDPTGDSNIRSQTQFIDEIETDSPVPFNLPLEFDGSPTYGEHDVEITLRYKDDVREEHFLTHQTTIMVDEPVVQDRSTSPIPGLSGLDAGDSGTGLDTMLLIIVAVIVLAVLIAIIVARRR